jgi:hypothetical protein
MNQYIYIGEYKAVHAALYASLSGGKHRFWRIRNACQSLNYLFCN